MVNYVETYKKRMEPGISTDTAPTYFRYTQIDWCNRMAHTVGAIPFMDAMGFISILIFLY